MLYVAKITDYKDNVVENYAMHRVNDYMIPISMQDIDSNDQNKYAPTILIKSTESDIAIESNALNYIHKDIIGLKAFYTKMWIDENDTSPIRFYLSTIPENNLYWRDLYKLEFWNTSVDNSLIYLTDYKFDENFNSSYSDKDIMFNSEGKEVFLINYIPQLLASLPDDWFFKTCDSGVLRIGLSNYSQICKVTFDKNLCKTLKKRGKVFDDLDELKRFYTKTKILSED
jgi:hypothetical protein